MLQLDSFEKALQSLQKAHDVRENNPRDEFILDACIQRFEYTYELCHKMLKRYLEMTEPSEALIDEMSFAELIRTGYERRILASSWDKWRNFRAARNITSYTYNEKKALEVYAVLRKFMDEAQFLLEKLRETNG